MSEYPATATRLVGREDDLAALSATLRTVQGGRMAAVVLCGEAGAGKTSLVEELAARAEDDGAIVLRGGALDIAESPPFPLVSSRARSSSCSSKPSVCRGSWWKSTSLPARTACVKATASATLE